MAKMRISVPRSEFVTQMLAYLTDQGIDSVIVTKQGDHFLLNFEIPEQLEDSITEAKFTAKFGRIGYQEYYLFTDLSNSRHLTRLYIPDEVALTLKTGYVEEFAERVASSMDRTYVGEAALQIAYLFAFHEINSVPVRVDMEGNVL